MTKQSDNTNSEIQKEKSNTLIHRGKDDNNSKIVYREGPGFRIFSNQRIFKYDNKYKTTMINSMSEALGSDQSLTKQKK